MERSGMKGVALDRKVRQIFCCGCGCDVDARLTNGAEIYPHREDLAGLPFWKCDKCGNFVGCHHKTKNPTEPLGCIPTPELKDARKKLHALIDPIWQSGRMSRRELYEAISRDVGWNYHTAKTRTIEEARAAYRAAAKYAYRSNQRPDMTDKTEPNGATESPVRVEGDVMRKRIDLELIMRTNEFRKFVGPRRSKDLTDYALRRVRGLSAWDAFNAGWNAALESRKPIKPKPLTKRTTSA